MGGGLKASSRWLLGVRSQESRQRLHPSTSAREEGCEIVIFKTLTSVFQAGSVNFRAIWWLKDQYAPWLLLRKSSQKYLRMLHIRTTSPPRKPPVAALPAWCDRAFQMFPLQSFAQNTLRAQEGSIIDTHTNSSQVQVLQHLYVIPLG